MKFLRRDWFRHGKFKRKKKQKWKKPTGRDNKMREKRKGYPAVVNIGYKKGERKSAVIVKNIKELENAKKDEIIIVANVGKKKKIEIVKKAKEMKIVLQNVNVKKFLEKVERSKKKKEEVKKEKTKTKKELKEEKKAEKKEEKIKTKSSATNKQSAQKNSGLTDKNKSSSKGEAKVKEFKK